MQSTPWTARFREGMASRVKGSRGNREKFSLPFDGASGPAQDRDHKSALSNRLQGAEREIDDLQEAVYGLVESLEAQGVSTARTKAVYGLTRATTGTAISVNTNSLPGMRRAWLKGTASQTGSITSISVAGDPLPCGTLDLAAIDPTTGFHDAGYYIGDIGPGTPIVIVGTLDVSGSHALWLEPEEIGKQALKGS